MLRTQRAVLQEWRVRTSSTLPGQVTVLNVGALAAEAGLIPAEVTVALPASRTLARLPSSPPVRVEDTLLATLRAVAERARGAVVKLTDGRIGAGSGVLYDSSGLIYTNYHVVRQLDRSRLRAELADGRALPARVLAGDDWTDIAVVKIEGDNLPTILSGDSRSVQPGDWIVAIGYAPLLPASPVRRLGGCPRQQGASKSGTTIPTPA